MATGGPDTRLHTAKESKIVFRLLKAPTNKPDPDTVDENGDAPIHVYVKRRDKWKFECLMTLLIHSRCDVDKVDRDGKTALHLAVEFNDIVSVKALIAFGAEVNCLDPSNQTPMHIARVKYDESELATTLIGLGGQEYEAIIKHLRDITLEQFANGDLGVTKEDIFQKRDLSGIEKGMIESTEVDESTDHGLPKAKVHFATPDASVEMGLSRMTVSEDVKMAMRRGEEEPMHSLIELSNETLPEEDEDGENREATFDPSEVHHKPCSLPFLQNGRDYTEVPPHHRPTALLENGRHLEDYPDGNMLPNQEGLTRDRLCRSEEAAACGDDGYAAWLQFKELRSIRRKNGRCMGNVNRMYGAGFRPSRSPLKSLTRSDEFAPVAFRAKKGESVLCLDGGGMKGLVQIEVLMQIEEATGRRITELFDWIVGTSTGGILALAMVYGGLSLDDIRQLYFEMKDEVFKKPMFGYACDTDALEAILKRTLGTEKRMYDVSTPKVMITAVNKANSNLKVVFFNNCFGDDYYSELIWKVGRYTSAAPLYFTEYEDYVDGGLLANNPCEYAMTKIQEHLDTVSRKAKISCMVSVGCGMYPSKEIGNTTVWKSGHFLEMMNLPGVLSKMKHLLKLFLSAMNTGEDVAKNCKSRCEKQNIPFYRFSPPLDDTVSPTESNNETLCDIILKAKILLQTYDTQMDELIQLLFNWMN